MYIEVNGARLYVDIEGAGLVPDGLSMRQEPTLILLHGGPARIIRSTNQHFPN